MELPRKTDIVKTPTIWQQLAIVALPMGALALSLGIPELINDPGNCFVGMDGDVIPVFDVPDCIDDLLGTNLG